MSLAVVKERRGWALFVGREALVRGLRERRDAFKIRHDIERKGWFRGTVTFAATGRRIEITVPADQAGWANDEDRGAVTPDAGEGTVDDL